MLPIFCILGDIFFSPDFHNSDDVGLKGFIPPQALHLLNAESFLLEFPLLLYLVANEDISAGKSNEGCN